MSFKNDKVDEILGEIKKRADGILEKWEDVRTPSRSVVREVERAVNKRAREKSLNNSKEALAHIYALDMRIKKIYSGLLSTLLHFFAARRERAALLRLRFSIDPSLSDSIEELIIREAERLSDLGPGEELDDDQTRGGRSQRKGEEATADGKAHEEQKAEDEKTADEVNSEAEEAETEGELSEESAEIQGRSENGITETLEGQSPEEQIADGAVTEGESDEISQENGDPDKIEKESNASETVSEEKIDKTDTPDNNARNYAEDMPLKADDPFQKSQEGRMSFIDEVMLDGMVIEGRDAAGRLDNKVCAEGKAVNVENRNTVLTENRPKDKEGYLYDRAYQKEDGKGINGIREISKEASANGNIDRINNYPSSDDGDLANNYPPLDDGDLVNNYPSLDETGGISEENLMRLELNDQLSQNEAAVLAIKEAQEAALRELMEDKIPITIDEVTNDFITPQITRNDSFHNVPEIKNEVKR